VRTLRTTQLLVAVLTQVWQAVSHSASTQKLAWQPGEEASFSRKIHFSQFGFQVAREQAGLPSQDQLSGNGPPTGF
jgi:hypothetical protein